MQLKFLLSNHKELNFNFSDNWHFIIYSEDNNFHNNNQECIALFNNIDSLLDNKSVLQFYQKVKMLNRHDVMNVQIIGNKLDVYNEENELIDVQQLTMSIEQFDAHNQQLIFDHVEFFDQQLSPDFQSQFPNGLLFLIFF